MKVIVDVSGERLDKYLANKTEYTRSKIEEMIDKDLITVNGKKAKASYKVEINDIIEYPDDYNKPNTLEGENIDIEIMYEDDDIIVVNKPSGMVVHPGNGNQTHTLVNALIGHNKTLSNINNDERPGIVHRIDKDTSGILLVAKNDRVHAVLADGFKNKTIKRKYIALLKGELKSDKATIDAPIGRDVKSRKKMCVTKDGKSAITHIKVLKHYLGYTLVELSLETGRTHQIRVHTKYIGHPIYNDPIYTNDKCSDFGQFLHAKSLEFEHPITHEHMYFESDLPSEFKHFLDNLESQIIAK